MLKAFGSFEVCIGLVEWALGGTRMVILIMLEMPLVHEGPLSSFRDSLAEGKPKTPILCEGTGRRRQPPWARVVWSPGVLLLLFYIRSPFAVSV